MDPRVQDYLHKKRLEEKRKETFPLKTVALDTYKRDVLLCAGLYNKVYSDVKTQEYCHSEWNPQTQSYLYYKQVPIAVTEEEFAEIEKYSVISKPL